MDEFYGAGNWRRREPEVYKRLRYTPASWTVEIHSVDVVVGTNGLHQDEFTRGDRPKDLLRNSIVTHSLGAAILNAKYVNSLPYNRIEQHFKRIGINISRQNMADWTIKFAERYLFAIYDRLQVELLKYPVNQEKYLRVFLENGDVPLDNSASERSIRTFCVRKKNWVLIDSIKGAQASAVLYSLAETAKLNNLNPYYYFDYLLSEIPKYVTYDHKTKTADKSKLSEATLEELLPWSPQAKERCYNGRH